jgi:hypothetical protein
MTLSRKTPLTRTAFKRSEIKAEPKRRVRKCVVCRSEFAPRSMTHKACKPECASAHIEAEKARTLKRERQEGLQKLKRKADHIKDAQIVFNRYIRLRDQLAGHPCISSGRPLDWSGNNVDAGHYRSRGSAPNLRFNEDNCHAQSKQDNRYGSGAAIDYRIGLIARIGLARVEALEASNTPHHWTVEELKAIKATYQQKIRDLKHEAK